MAKRKIQSEEFDPNAKTVIENPTVTNTPVPADPVQAIVEKAAQKATSEVGFIEIEGLPTKGALYPEGTLIKGRSMNVKEVKALSNMNGNNANNIINEILKSTTRGIDVSDIYTVDKLYIVFWLRANTYPDSGFEVGFECGECNKDSTYQFELSNLKVQDFEEERHEKYLKGLTTPSGDKINFKLLQVSDEEENDKFVKTHETATNDFDEETVSLARMITHINGEKKGTIAKYTYLTEEISPADYIHIQSFTENHGMGVQPSINVTCKKCGGDTDTVLPFRPDFFLPKVTA